MPEATTTDTVEPSTHPAGAPEPAGLVVRYRYADGILIEGKTSPHRNEVKRAQPRWRWCGSLRKWVVPRTRERVLSSHQVEVYAEGLRTAGVPNVRVDYQEPRPGDVLDVDQVGEVVETLEERALDRAGQRDGAAAWLDRMKPITARHFLRWLPTSYRNATGILDGYRSRYGVELTQPQPQPHGIGRSAARRVLEDVFGIDFDAEQAASRFIETPEHEATETTPGPEDEEDADSIEMERLADELAATTEGTADEHTTGHASAGPEPRSKLAPGSLGTVEHEGFALLAPPGEGMRVHAPTGHQPPLFDVTGSDHPAMLVQMRSAGRAMVPARRRALWADMAPRIRGPPPRSPALPRAHGLDRDHA